MHLIMKPKNEAAIDGRESNPQFWWRLQQSFLSMDKTGK